MITDGEKWHYLASKSSALLGGITSNHNGDFYSLKLFSFIQHKKLTLKNMKKHVMIMITVM